METLSVLGSSELASAVFVVVDLETTGRSPDSSEILEIGAVKLRGGEVLETFETLVKPRGRIPMEIRHITGIHPDLVEHQPFLEEVLPGFLHFLGDAVLVAHNSPFDRGFLNAAVARQFGAPLENKDLCTCRLARRLMPGLRSKGLDALTEYFQLDNAARHRAMGDARVTAELLVRFTEMARTQHGIETLEELLLLQRSRTRGVSGMGAGILGELKQREYPKAPGVYFMKDGAGEILYIGKAKNLRNRLQSYFHDSKSHTRKVIDLMGQVRDIEYRITGSELEALLLEARLIKGHQPYFNRQIKNYKALPFIKVSVEDEYPRMSMTQEIDEEAAVYFGPFSSKRRLEKALEELNRIFRLRTCTDVMFRKYRQAPCMAFHIEQCSGPCAGMVDEAGYGERVEDLLRFLEGEGSQVTERLVAKRDWLAETLRYEEAGMVQGQLFQLLNLQYRSSLLVQAVHRNNCLIVLPDGVPGWRKVHFVYRGRPVGVFRIDPGVEAGVALEGILAEVERIYGEDRLEGRVGVRVPKEAFEETRIIANWLHERDPEGGEESGVVVPLTGGGRAQWKRQLRKALFEEEE